MTPEKEAEIRMLPEKNNRETGVLKLCVFSGYEIMYDFFSPIKDRTQFSTYKSIQKCGFNFRSVTLKLHTHGSGEQMGFQPSEMGTTK